MATAYFVEGSIQTVLCDTQRWKRVSLATITTTGGGVTEIDKSSRMETRLVRYGAILDG